MPATKKWTEEQVKILRDGYDAHNSDASVTNLMETLDMTKRRVIGKLAHLGDYIKQEVAPKAKRDEGPTKGEIINAMVQSEATRAENDPEFTPLNFEGVDNSTKNFLKALASRLTA